MLRVYATPPISEVGRVYSLRLLDVHVGYMTSYNLQKDQILKYEVS